MRKGWSNRKIWIAVVTGTITAFTGKLLLFDRIWKQVKSIRDAEQAESLQYMETLDKIRALDKKKQEKYKVDPLSEEDSKILAEILEEEMESKRLNGSLQNRGKITFIDEWKERFVKKHGRNAGNFVDEPWKTVSIAKYTEKP